MTDFKHSPLQAANELREQLSSEKRRLGFLFGAGISMAVGVPGVIALTEKISTQLKGEQKEVFEKIKGTSKSQNIEHILNRIRTIRELIVDETDEYDGIKGKTFGQELDVAICSAISEIVNTSTVKDIPHHLIFSNWLSQNQANRYAPIELFTTNYDLLLEKALENNRIPYFDGFVGSINPFLIPECVEAENNKDGQMSYVPYSWLRLWKLHGSINWYLIEDNEHRKRIIRSSNRSLSKADELMIYPSKQKYDESRRLPFLVFQDRLRKFLSTGEILLIISGYSFGDEHLNEILFQALRSNKRLAITALMYGDSSSGSKREIDSSTLSHGQQHPNLTILGPDKACIGGIIAEWSEVDPDLDSAKFWDASGKNFSLGDFKKFADYLQHSFGVLSKLPGPAPTTFPVKTPQI